VAKQQRRQPIWHPITALPVIATLVDGQLEGAEEQYQTLQEARWRPGALDDATVERVLRVFSEEMEFLDIYDEQLDRWRKGPLTPVQQKEVERLGAQVARNREVASSILDLAEELNATTINALMAKSDLELGLEALLGGFPSAPLGRRARKKPR
jgi:signal transduction histidine kinase